MMNVPDFGRCAGVLGCVLVCVSASSLHAEGARRGAVVRSSSVIEAFSGVAQEGEHVRAVLRAGAVESLRDAARQSRRISINLPTERAESLPLEMEPFRVTTEATRFVRVETGGPREVDRPGLTMFRGTVAGDSDSLALLAVDSAGGLRGLVDARGARFQFGSAGGDAASAEVTISRVSRPSSAPDVDHVCGLDVNDARFDRRVARGAGSTAGVTPTGLARLALVAVDTDAEYLDLFGGNVAAAEAYIELIVGAVSTIYERDLGVRLRLDFVRTWPGGGVPFDSSDLNNFANYWDFFENPFSYNLIHLFSGRRDLPFGGIAFLGGSECGFQYGISGYLTAAFLEPVVDGQYDNWDLNVVAHEMGHNMGTPHTHDLMPVADSCAFGTHSRGTIMSYCHTTAGQQFNMDVRFHARIQDVIDSQVQQFGCLSFDCNGNNTPDNLDISGGGSDDTNFDGIPDECQDCDGNGTLDPAESNLTTDSNQNGVLDVCEPDCNGNGVPDITDIDGGAADVNGNLVPDECEPDCDGNGTADYTEILADGSLDIDRNRVLDSCQDCDGNLQTDYLDMQRAGNVFVASSTGSIREYHAESGVPIRSLASPRTTSVEAMEFDDRGILYATDSGADRVLEIDVLTDSTETLLSASDGLVLPMGLAVRKDGRVLVASRGTDEIFVVHPDFPESAEVLVSSGIDGVDDPGALMVGPSDVLWVGQLGGAVRRFDAMTGAFLDEFTAGGGGGPADVRSMALLPDGRLVLTGDGEDAAFEYAADGSFVGVFNDLATADAGAVRVGPRGTVMIARGGPSPRVIEYRVENGKYIRFFARADSFLTSPRAMAIKPTSLGDCNENRTPDSCDVLIAGMDDCDANLVPDACQLATISGDCNQNGAVDACECFIADPVIVGTSGVRGNRFLELDPPAGCETAIRVTFSDLPPGLDEAEGAAKWVQSPSLQIDVRGTLHWGAVLGCDPVFTNWPDEPLYVAGPGIVPGAAYGIEAVQAGCALQIEGNESAVASGETALEWGDLLPPYGDDPQFPQPDIIDILATVDSFLGVPSAPPLLETDLEPELPNGSVDINDILACVDGFLGRTFPYAPQACP